MSKWRYKAVITIPGAARARVNGSLNDAFSLGHQIIFTAGARQGGRNGPPTHWISSPTLTVAGLVVLREILDTTPGARAELTEMIAHPQNPDLSQYFASIPPGRLTIVGARPLPRDYANRNSFVIQT